MKSESREILYGVSFFVTLIGVTLLVLSIVNDFTSTKLFSSTPWMVSIGVTVLGGVLLAGFSKKG